MRRGMSRNPVTSLNLRTILKILLKTKTIWLIGWWIAFLTSQIIQGMADGLAQEWARILLRMGPARRSRDCTLTLAMQIKTTYRMKRSKEPRSKKARSQEAIGHLTSSRRLNRSISLLQTWKTTGDILTIKASNVCRGRTTLQTCRR